MMPVADGEAVATVRTPGFRTRGLTSAPRRCIERQPGRLTLPAGPAAVCAYTGPYDHIGAAHDALQQWLVAQSRQPVGPAYEFYLNDPVTTAPAALRTNVLRMVR